MKKYENKKDILKKQLRDLFNNYELTFFRQYRISLLLEKLTKYKLGTEEKRLVKKIKSKINFTQPKKQWGF